MPLHVVQKGMTVILGKDARVWGGRNSDCDVQGRWARPIVWIVAYGLGTAERMYDWEFCFLCIGHMEMPWVFLGNGQCIVLTEAYTVVLSDFPEERNRRYDYG